MPFFQSLHILSSGARHTPALLPSGLRNMFSRNTETIECGNSGAAVAGQQRENAADLQEATLWQWPILNAPPSEQRRLRGSEASCQADLSRPVARQARVECTFSAVPAVRALLEDDGSADRCWRNSQNPCCGASKATTQRLWPVVLMRLVWNWFSENQSIYSNGNICDALLQTLLVMPVCCRLSPGAICCRDSVPRQPLER